MQLYSCQNIHSLYKPKYYSQVKSKKLCPNLLASIFPIYVWIYLNVCVSMFVYLCILIDVVYGYFFIQLWDWNMLSDHIFLWIESTFIWVVIMMQLLCWVVFENGLDRSMDDLNWSKQTRKEFLMKFVKELLLYLIFF